MNEGTSDTDAYTQPNKKYTHTNKHLRESSDGTGSADAARLPRRLFLRAPPPLLSSSSSLTLSSLVSLLLSSLSLSSPSPCLLPLLPTFAALTEAVAAAALVAAAAAARLLAFPTLTRARLTCSVSFFFFFFFLV
jgi:hypothetical protein